MARIQISEFQGIAPRIDSRLLGGQQGQVAENLKLTSKALQSWRGQVLNTIPALSTPKLETIYLYKGTGTDLFLTWTTDVDVVKAPIANDTTSRIYYTEAGTLQASDNAADNLTGVDNGGSNIFPESSILVGIPAPTLAPSVALGSAGAGTTVVPTLYVYTFVSVWGEESALSPASAIINVDHTDGNVDLSALEITYPGAGTTRNTIQFVRIYRSSVGVNQTAYRFVAEISPTATFTDNVIDALLGEVVASTDFDLPPANIFGLIDAGNGIMVAFTLFEILFSEPYQPHAWPIKYRLATFDTIVGGGLFGNTIVVTTLDRPLLLVGNHPSTMTMTVLPDHQACVSKQGIVSLKGRVIYPSPDGLYSIGYGGYSLLTEPLYDRDTWQERNPSQIRASYWDTRYIAFTDDAGLVIETANNQISASDFNIDVDAVYTDPENDRLYISETSALNVNIISEFNAAGQRLAYMWKSKTFSLGSLATITCGKILAQYGELLTNAELVALTTLIANIIAANGILLGGLTIRGELNGNQVNEFAINASVLLTPPSVPITQNVVIKLYGDGDLIGTATSVDATPFRFPSGGQFRQYEVEIETFTDVNQITIASSITELVD